MTILTVGAWILLGSRAVSAGPCDGMKGKVIEKSDRFSGTVSLSMTNFRAEQALGRLAPNVGAEFRPSGMLVQLNLMGSFPDWRYLRCGDAFILADGQPVKTRRVDHDGEVFSGGVIEKILITLDLPAIQQLGQASVVEWKVCADEFRADQEFVCVLHEFAVKVADRLAFEKEMVAHPQ